MIYVYGYVDSQMYEKEIDIVRKYSWAKVKKKFYEESGFRYVSTHPMFGPTFDNLGQL